jgi:hypothetical protein
MLAADVEAWQGQDSDGHDDSLFYRGRRLWRTLDVVAVRVDKLTASERRFLAASAVAFSAEEQSVGNHASARSLLATAAELAPTWPEPCTMLHSHALADDNFAEALEAYRALADLGQAPLPEKYCVDAIVDKSDFGIVFRVHDREWQMMAVVTLAYAATPERPDVAAGLREAYSGLTSQYISRFLELSYWRDRYYITAEWVEGPTLRSQIGEQGKLPSTAAYQVGADLLAALGDGHTRASPWRFAARQCDRDPPWVHYDSLRRMHLAGGACAHATGAGGPHSLPRSLAA